MKLYIGQLTSGGFPCNKGSCKASGQGYSKDGVVSVKRDHA